MKCEQCARSLSALESLAHLCMNNVCTVNSGGKRTAYTSLYCIYLMPFSRPKGAHLLILHVIVRTD